MPIMCHCAPVHCTTPTTNANSYVVTNAVTMGFHASRLTRSAVSSEARHAKANTTEPMNRSAAHP